MDLSESKQFYNKDPDFKQYVDKCREADGRSVEEELELKITQGVADYYKEQKNIH